MHTLIGNDKAYQTLAAEIRGGRLSHALLLEGPKGCGKSVFARETAQAILCSAPREERPCGVCRDCRKAEKEIHPDILTYGGEGGSRSFHIDTVRALRQEAFVSPNEAAGKVLILQNVQDMSVQAQNALLKIIEEPPAGVTFLLTCENRSALLETIRSRVRVLPLELPTVAQCREHLSGLRPDLPADRLEEAARHSGGNIGRALSLLDAEEGDAIPDDLAAQTLYDACVGEEFAALTALSAYERDRRKLSALLERMGQLLSEAIRHPEKEKKLEPLVRRAGPLRLMEILAIIRDTALAVTQNVGGLLLVTSFCARIRSVMADA